MSDFGALLTGQIPRLRRFARSLTGDVNNADELVQDCLERAWSRAHRWQRGTDLRAWLFRMMHNLFLNQLRKQQRRPQTQPLMGREPVQADAGPEQQLRLDEIGLALEQLNADQRGVLALVVLEGLSYDEVAAILEIPVGTVMSRLHRAREQLRRTLSGSNQSATLRRVK